MTDGHLAICKQCGAPADVSDVVSRHSISDPLLVSECGNCGSIVRIGGHDW